MMPQENLFLLGDVARSLRCAPHRINYLLTSGRVPEPLMRLGNRRIFTPEDVRRIAATLNTPTMEINEQ